MADSGLSASELRQRYHRGGSATDDELSSSQLRARHGIPSNKGDKLTLLLLNIIIIIIIINFCYNNFVIIILL